MRFFLFASFLFMSISSFSQITLSGRIIDESGKGVPYASVYFKKNRHGTSADGAGYYRLEGVMPGDSICCTQTNFESSTRSAGENEYLSFVLQPREISPVIIYKNGRFDLLRKGIDSTRAQKATAAYVKKGIKNIPEEDDVFTRVKIDASFPGGRDAFKKYMERNIALPDTITSYYVSADGTLSGYVNVQFSINRKGEATDIFILNSFNKAAENAVIAALHAMPAWTPAMQNGNFIESEKTASVYFILEQVKRAR